MPELWTIKQVMSYLKVSKATVYRYIRDGRLPAPMKTRLGVKRWDVEAVRKALVE